MKKTFLIAVLVLLLLIIVFSVAVIAGKNDFLLTLQTDTEKSETEADHVTLEGSLFKFPFQTYIIRGRLTVGPMTYPLQRYNLIDRNKTTGVSTYLVEFGERSRGADAVLLEKGRSIQYGDMLITGDLFAGTAEAISIVITTQPSSGRIFFQRISVLPQI